MTKLRVDHTNTLRARTTEAAFEAEFARACAFIGLPTWHNNMPVLPGLPDRYLGKGRWVEFKVFNEPPLSYSPLEPMLNKALRESQKRIITNLLEMGDEVWIGVLFRADRTVILPKIQTIWQGGLAIDTKRQVFKYERAGLEAMCRALK